VKIYTNHMPKHLSVALNPHAMNPHTPAINRSSTLSACLLLGLFSLLVAGCEAKKPIATSSPTSREAELTKTIEELRGKLTAAEQATEQANARAAVALAQVKNAPTDQSNAEPVTDNTSAADPKSTDTSYVVVKKTFTPGQLISAATGANPNATDRRAAEYWITFKGVQSGKEYPALEVKETSYNQFLEGAAYSPQDLNQAKPTPPANDSSTPSS
jgi:hypothetical protein